MGKRHIMITFVAAVVILLSACSAFGQSTDEAGMDRQIYTQISQDKAKEMMEKDDGHIIVDVRRPGEVVTGAEDTGTSEDNGIWTAEDVPVQVRYDRMWEYSDFAKSSDQKMIADITDAIRALKVGEESMMVTDDYTDILTFTFEDGTTQRFEFEDQCWVTEDQKRYQVEGMPALRGLLNDLMDEKEQTMILKIGETQVPVTWEENASVSALMDLAGENPLTIQMSMYGGFEQVGPIGQGIVRDDVQTTTEPGDIVLYSGDQIVIFYGSNSWAYTRLGHVELSREELEDLLGNGDVVLTIQ